MIKQIIKRILILNIIFALMLMLYRIMFTTYYFNLFELFKIKQDLFKAFFLGFRFDISILGIINSLVVITFVAFLFINKKELFIKFIKTLKCYYTIVFCLIFFLSAIDFCFYNYLKKHISYLIFEIFNHKLSYLWYISKNEHFMLLIIFVIFILVCFLIYFICSYCLEKNIDKYDTEIYNYKTKIVVSSIIVIITFITSFNVINIRTDLSSYFYVSYYTWTLERIVCKQVFDGFNVIKEYFEKDMNFIEYFGYNNNIKKAFIDYFDINEKEIGNIPESPLEKTAKYNKNIENIKPNVILIVMESVGSDLLYYDNDEFNILGELRHHFKEDIVFYNCLYSYTNTQTSVDTIMLDMVRIPKRKDAYAHISLTFFNDSYFTFATLPYNCNKFKTYNLAQGLPYLPDKYFNVNKNGNRNDELILNNIFDALYDESNEQKFIFCVTQENHHPFIISSDYKVSEIKVPKNLSFKEEQTFKHLNTHQYSCQKVGEFLTKLKKSKFADNTIVAITGDHKTRIENFYEDIILKKVVPFYLYIPKKLMPSKEKIDTSRIVSHLDIMPTLYELSLSSVTYYSMGTSVFSDKYQNAISSNYDDAIIVNGDDMCRYDVNNDETESYKLKRENGKLAQYEQTKMTKKHEKMIKQYKAGVAISQYIINETKKINKSKE